MGIGDWGLGIGDWALSPFPNPQSPIPNPHVFFNFSFFCFVGVKDIFEFSRDNDFFFIFLLELEKLLFINFILFQFYNKIFII